MKPSLNCLFTGRENESAIVQNALSAALAREGEHPARTFVLSGVGGIGKSELALKVAHNLRSKYVDTMLLTHGDFD